MRSARSIAALLLGSCLGCASPPITVVPSGSDPAARREQAPEFQQVRVENGGHRGTVWDLAYSADGRDLVTIENEDAKKKSLTVIEDPRLKEIAEADEKGSLGIRAGGPWGPYPCPSCEQPNLQLWHSGFWD